MRASRAFGELTLAEQEVALAILERVALEILRHETVDIAKAPATTRAANNSESLPLKVSTWGNAALN